MKWLIVHVLPWVVSVMTIVYIVLAGNKHRNTWVLCFITQCLWAVWIVSQHAWGLLLVTVWLMVQSVINHYKWKRDNEIRSI